MKLDAATRARLIAEAWALIRRGDRFGIAARFLRQHGVVARSSP